MKALLVSSLALACAITACGPAEPIDQESSEALISPSAQWLGTWVSPPCGNRTYERWITLKSDAVFNAQDRVAPCPKGVVCVWSGILSWSGKWQVEGKGEDVVLIEHTSKMPNKGSAPHPAKLEWDEITGAPVEVTSSGLCPYFDEKDIIKTESASEEADSL